MTSFTQTVDTTDHLSTPMVSPSIVMIDNR